MAKRVEEELSQIRDLAEAAARVAGVEVVDLMLNRGPKRWLLRLDIDRAGPRGIGIEECQHVSRELEAALDQCELLQHAYTLEVSSPGIDRPIRSVDDMRRNTGRMVDVELREPVRGERWLTGTLMGLDGGDVRLRGEDEEEIRLPLDGVLLVRQHLPF